MSGFSFIHTQYIYVQKILSLENVLNMLLVHVRINHVTVLPSRRYQFGNSTKHTI